MKKDNLREFVSANKDSFDDQQPGADILAKLHARIKLEHAIEAPESKIVKFQYWWAAAILLIGTTYFAVFQSDPGDNKITALGKKARIKAPAVATDQKALQPSQQTEWVAQKETERNKPVKSIQMRSDISASANTGRTKSADNPAEQSWTKDLKSESSSARLAAILKLAEKKSVLSEKDLRLLFTTMNNDASSNVRLAVLEMLQKYEDQPLVQEFILQSVAKQDDPFVQMELLSSLSLDEAIKIKNQLRDLSQDPNHIDLVREQAYAILFRSNIDI